MNAPREPLLRPSSDALLSIRGLTVAFDDGRMLTQVLHGLDLDIARGQTVGMVGESGCGKSVAWLAVLRLLGPRARIGGTISLDGRRLDRDDDQAMAPIRGRRIAMIFQDPASSLNPVMRIGRQLTESLQWHRGLDASAAQAEAQRLLDRVRIPAAAQRLQAWPHELSGGMNQRVMIAMALAGEPDLLIADEPTTALDVTIQAQILDLLAELQAETGRAMVMVTHDLGVVAEVCDRVVVLYAGRIVESAPAARLFSSPWHPYTRGLLGALPDVQGPRRRLAAIGGTVPMPGRLPTGCAFAPRCPVARPLCREVQPMLLECGGGQAVACVGADGVATGSGLRIDVLQRAA